MDDGSKIGDSLKLSTNSLGLKDLNYLQELFFIKYDIETSLHKTGVEGQYCIYIKKSCMPKLISIVYPYIIPSMRYKLSL